MESISANCEVTDSMDKMTEEFAIIDKHEKLLVSGDFLPESFGKESEQIAEDIVAYMCHHEHCTEAPNRICSTMRHLVDDTLQHKLSMMRQLVAQLQLTSCEQLHLLHHIASSLFDDDLVTWGRIVTLHAFCGYLARYCQEKHIHGSSDVIAEILTSIVVKRLGLWIVANGGWAAFEQKFPAVCFWGYEGVWKGIIMMGVLIGALLLFYFTVRFISPPR